MFEIITAIYTFWNYIDDANTIRKIGLVLSNYFQYLKLYFKNPEVRIKYSRIFTSKTNNKTIENIYNSLIEKKKEFTDDFSKTQKKLDFELTNSKLSYVVQLEQNTETNHSIIFETKYVSFYPLRYFKKLNEITSEFNQVSDIISHPLKITASQSIIFVEIQLEAKNNQLITYEKLNAEISFKENKIQINNYSGTEHGEFILYFIVKWFKEYHSK